MGAKKLIILFLLSCIGSFIHRLYAQPCYHYYPRSVYHRVPVVAYPTYQTVVVRERPKVVVVEEPNDVVYYHKKPKVTHVYEEEERQVMRCNDEIINVDEAMVKEPRFTYSDMWKQTVWFNEDSYKIKLEPNKITLENVSSFLYENPDANITIYGYASKRHGSYEYNKQLASNRCRSVRMYLVDEYQIPYSRIKLVVRGTDSPEYYVDKWNQCVVIKCD